MQDTEALHAYVEAVRRLLSHGGYERTGDLSEQRRWGRAHVSNLLDQLGRPDARHTVHVAGSKGKGSTAAMGESILRAAGAHTLLMTSPDLHQSRERIAIDGAPLDYARFAALADRLLAEEGTAGWSYFELMTVLGWLAAEDAGCDWQVVEVGLGGRLDTTNTLASKEVAVIMPIDLEHTAILGDTIPAIAKEKAGIIIGRCEVVTAPMRASALEVIQERAAEMGARLHNVPEECALRVTSHSLDGQVLDLRTPLRTYRGLKLPLLGQHQAENAATAVRAAELAFAAVGEELPAQAVNHGLETVRWPGRFEVVRRRPLVIVDGLHTPLAARRFREAVKALSLPRPHVYVAGLLAGKDAEAIAAALVDVGDDFIIAPPASPRAADINEIRRRFIDAGANVQQAASIAEAIEVAEELAGQRGSVFVVGSLYTAAEAREHLLGIAGDRSFGLR
jgi:dihydrofolate synthase/folylpolyglutamate synthase